MLRIKKEYQGKVVQVNGENRKYLLDCSKVYSQSQLENMSKAKGFRDYVEEFDEDEEFMEVDFKTINPDDVQIDIGFPELDNQELDSMSLTELRNVYPFVKARSKDDFIEQLLELNYGNPIDEEDDWEDEKDDDY